MNRNIFVRIGIAVVIIGISIIAFVSTRKTSSKPLNYGISPYQDTILPVVADELGWYREANLNVELRVLPWGEVMPALASHSVDVAIQNFNSFQAAYANTTGQGADLEFFYPLFVFKGSAIVAFPDSGLKPLSYYLKQDGGDRSKAISDASAQLRGKKVYATKGTEMEQIVRAAMSKAGLRDSDLTLVHAEPDLGLNALLHDKTVVFSGGVTERMKAQHEGAIVILEAADLTPPVIDGLVTTRKFASEHKEELFQLIDLWYRTIAFMQSDLKGNSQVVLRRLSQTASIKYTPEEYAQLWTQTEVFPASADEMQKMVLASNSAYYWRRSWQANNDFLKQQNSSFLPVPETAFGGENIQQEYLVWKAKHK